MQNTTALTPLEKMLQSFPKAYQKSNGWWTHDDNPRFDFIEDQDGKIGINPWTGRTAEDVLSMGNPPLQMRDLYKNGAASKSRFQKRDKLDLLTLAWYLKIDWRFLEQLGYSDGYKYENKKHGWTNTCVKLGGYCYPDGTPSRKVRLRLSISPDARVRFISDENTPGEQIACGLHRLDEARNAGYLFIGEGESDGATMWYHGLPFVGVPGASAVKSIDVSLLHDIPAICIIEEPDQVKKNQEKGQGFYKDLREHLRDGDYTGEINTVNWKDATGYKDPSELHKCIYRECKQQDETVFFKEVHAKFLDVVEQAKRQAIPEGNTALITQDEMPAYTPPQPKSDSEKLQWFLELCAVPASVLSPAQKIVLMVLAIHTNWWDPESGGWYQVDSSHLAKLAGVSSQSVLSAISYLTNSAGLFVKKREKVFYTPENSKKQKCYTVLYVQPSEKAWMRYPSTFHVNEDTQERNHGGARVAKPKVQCEVCHSENVDIVCRDCHHTQHQQEEDVQEHIEVTAEILPMEYEEEEKDPNVKLTFHSLEEEDEGPKCQDDSIEDSSFYNVKMTFHSEEENTEDPNVKLTFHSEEQQLAALLGADIVEPCTCGCTLARPQGKYSMCVTCYPPRGIPDDVWDRLTALASQTKPQNATNLQNAWRAK